MTLQEFILRILAAVLFGFLIGLERQLTGHVAGIRINILVSLGTCLFVLFSIIMEAPDATRIAAQTVTGVGFLCSGIIFKDGVQVRGLNTAATIWCTAAIGVLTSSGKLIYALTATLLLLAANLIFRGIAEGIRPLSRFDDTESVYKITVSCPQLEELKIRSKLIRQANACKLTTVNLESRMIHDQVEICATLSGPAKVRPDAAERLIQKVSEDSGVTNVGWEII